MLPILCKEITAYSEKSGKYGCEPGSVADPGCLSRILIFTHPGSRIQKQEEKRGVKKIFLSNIFL